MSQFQNLDIYSGENRTLTLYARDPSNNVQPLTSTAAIVWRVGKPPRMPSQKGAIFQKAGTIVDAANGVFTVSVEPGDTWLLGGNFVHVALTTEDGTLTFQNNGSDGEAPAVTFDGSTDLATATFALGAGVKAFSIFTWARMDGEGGTILSATSNDQNFDFFQIAGDPGGCNIVLTTPTDAGDVQIESVDFFDFTVWRPVLLSFDYTADDDPKGAIYVGDSLASFFLGDTNTGSLTGDGSPWLLGNGSLEYTGDLSTFWFAPISLLDGSGAAIPDATRRLFTTADGKWLDPAGFPSGALILFDGDAATYSDNQGSGGAFVLEGDALTDAASGPPSSGGAPQDLQFVNDDGDEIVFVNDSDGFIQVVTAGILRIRPNIQVIQ